jgi:hypothetical protein
MEIAEKVSVKPIMRLRVEGNVGGIADDNEKAGNDGFEIMANVVWAGIGTAIMDELGGVVFCAGRPNDFRKVRDGPHPSVQFFYLLYQHHEVTHAFIHSLEFLAPSLHSIQAMRSHPVYVAFDRRWQHPVYLQMRWKEIVPKLEDALAVTRIEPVSSKGMK